MLDRPGAPLADTLRETTERWIEAFSAALAGRSAAGLSALFVADSHWRNLFGISWHFATFSGNATVVAELLARGRKSAPEISGSIMEHSRRATPWSAAATWSRRSSPSTRSMARATAQFGCCASRTGLRKPGPFPPRSISIRICEARASGSPAESTTRDFAGPDWLEARQAESAYDDRDPDVLIVGGGHAGISVAVEAKRIGLTSLVIDREERIGDNWRLRYRGLKLHNKTPVNHLRYLPFPKTFPDYIPKDKIANWLESYVDIMEVDFWTRCAFEGADYDEASQRWTARLTREGAAARFAPNISCSRPASAARPAFPRSQASITSRERCCIPAASRRAGNGPDGA